MVVADKKLSEELFSEADQAALKELLEQAARARLHPSVLNFVTGVENIFNSRRQERNKKDSQLAETSGRGISAAVDEHSEPLTGGSGEKLKRAQGGSVQAAVMEYIVSHPGEEIRVVSASGEISSANGFLPSSVTTTINKFRRGEYPVEGGVVESGEGTMKFVRRQEAGNAAAVITGSPEKASQPTATVQQPQKPPQEPTAEKPVTIIRQPVAQPTSGIPAAQQPHKIPAEQGAGVVSQRHAEVASVHTVQQPKTPARPQVQLPQELTFTRFLELATENLDEVYRDKIHRHALRILGQIPADRKSYSYSRVRAYETFVSAVEKLSADNSISNGLLAALGMLDTSDTGRMIRFSTGLEKAAGDPASMARLLSELSQREVETRQTPRQRPRAPEVRDVATDPRPGAPVSVRPPRPVAETDAKKPAADYVSRLLGNVKIHPDDEKGAVSYLMRLLGVKAETETPADNRRVSLAEEFIAIVKHGSTLGVLPREFYAALGKLDAADPEQATKFQRSIRSTNGDEDRIRRTSNAYMGVAEQERQNPYQGQRTPNPPGRAKTIKTIAEMYGEDPGMEDVAGKTSAFADDMVRARNALVADHTGDDAVGNFYHVMKMISGYGVDRGGVYADVLRMIRISPMAARTFLASVKSKGISDIREIDKELDKYTGVGARTYRPGK
ncbi:MAG: hypothetical protein HY516_01670 [Candidatus Aenigmarchaeota archaeon]|nr:hypothetical protein [Candidatus Aenigmarchaeota archaeon]